MSIALPERMCAAVLMGHGGLDRVEYHTEWPVPRPAAGEVLIEVAACGVNNTDVNTRTAWYSPTVRGATTEGGTSGFEQALAERASWGGASVQFPRIQGADIVGRVVAVGAGVHDGGVGTRVIVDPWLRDPQHPRDRSRATFIGSERDGGFAQYVCVPMDNAHPVHSSWSDAELATLPCSYVTAENMLCRARVTAADAILVTGASGGVGSALVQLARRRGARVVAIAAPEKAAQVRELGADVLSRAAGALGPALEETLGRPSVDVVADVVGGSGFGSLLDVLVAGGRYVTAGAIAGAVVELDLRTLYLKDLEAIGATVPDPEVFPALVGHVEREEVRPVLARTYPLEKIVRAQAEFLEKRHVGKLVLIPPHAPERAGACAGAVSGAIP